MNPSGALIYLISTLTDLYVTAILLRLLLQWVRADYYNPLSQVLIKVTNPVLVPARRLVPSIGKLDTAAVLVMLMLELLQLVLISLLSETHFGFQFLLLFAVRKLLIALLLVYFVLIIAMVLVSWFARQSRHPLIPLIYQLTDPVLRPIQRYIPPLGGVDLSPLDCADCATSAFASARMVGRRRTIERLPSPVRFRRRPYSGMQKGSIDE